MCGISSEERSRICLLIQQLDDGEIRILKDSANMEAFANWEYLNKLYEQFRCTVFRGQRDSEWELQPSCMRDDLGNDIASNVIRRTRVNMLQQKITSTVLYKKFNTVTVRGPIVQSKTIYNDPWILAQHFGLSTPLIDYTSNPEVAMFFACTKHSENGFEPLTAADIDACPYGRIFFDEYVMSVNSKIHESHQSTASKKTSSSEWIFDTLFRM